MAAPGISELRAFYGDALGLPVLEETPDRVVLGAGASRVVFRASEAPDSTYHFAFRVLEHHFLEAKRWLAEHAELTREDGEDEFEWDFWGALAVYAYDPVGNIIELMAFPGLPPAGDGQFSPEAIVGIAELGLPVADPASAVDRLRAAFAIGLWDRDEVTPDKLTPVGEQGATFLITPIGRTWLFGGPAADHPLEVVLGGVRAGLLEFDEHPYRIEGLD